MSKIVSFFLAGPTAPFRLQMLLIVAAIAAAGVLGLFTWGLYWRGEYREAKASLVALQAQGQILADSVRTCSAGSIEASKVGNAAVETGEQLLKAARKLHAGGKQQIARIEDLLKKPNPPGADCNSAWSEVEKSRVPQ